MSISLQDLKVRAGDSILVAWRKFLRWAETYKPRKGSANVRFNMVPGHGTYVTAVFDAPVYVGSFRVGLTKNAITMGLGTISEAGAGTFMPYMGDTRVDGLDLDGSQQTTAPTFNISGPPNEDLMSWIVLQATVDQKTGQMDPKKKDSVQVAHVNSLALPKNQLIGQQEVAIIRWQDKETPAEVFQIALHNLKHEFLPVKKGGNTGRHFFYAV